MDELDRIAEDLMVSRAWVKRSLDKLVRRGIMELRDGRYVLTEKGEELILNSRIYGYPLVELVAWTRAIRDWAIEQSRTRPGAEVTIEDVKREVPTLFSNNKIGRILVALGFEKRKCPGHYRYVVPSEVRRLSLRDLTRVKNRRGESGGGGED